MNRVLLRTESLMFLGEKMGNRLEQLSNANEANQSGRDAMFWRSMYMAGITEEVLKIFRAAADEKREIAYQNRLFFYVCELVKNNPNECDFQCDKIESIWERIKEELVPEMEERRVFDFFNKNELLLKQAYFNELQKRPLERDDSCFQDLLAFKIEEIGNEFLKFITTKGEVADEQKKMVYKPLKENGRHKGVLASIEKEHAFLKKKIEDYKVILTNAGIECDSMKEALSRIIETKHSFSANIKLLAQMSYDLEMMEFLSTQLDQWRSFDKMISDCNPLNNPVYKVYSQLQDNLTGQNFSKNEQWKIIIQKASHVAMTYFQLYPSRICSPTQFEFLANLTSLESAISPRFVQISETLSFDECLKDLSNAFEVYKEFSEHCTEFLISIQGIAQQSSDELTLAVRANNKYFEDYPFWQAIKDKNLEGLQKFSKEKALEIMKQAGVIRGYSVLHFAVLHNFAKGLSWMIDEGADLKILTRKKTLHLPIIKDKEVHAVELAAALGNLDLLIMLLNSFKEPDQNLLTKALECVIDRKRILDFNHPNFSESMKQSWFDESLNAIEELLNRGADRKQGLMTNCLLMKALSSDEDCEFLEKQGEINRLLMGSSKIALEDVKAIFENEFINSEDSFDIVEKKKWIKKGALELIAIHETVPKNGSSRKFKRFSQQSKRHSNQEKIPRSKSSDILDKLKSVVS